MPSTTARIVSALDTVLFEIGAMNRALDAARDVAPEDRSVLKRELAALHDRADALMNWLTEQRLETPKT